MQRLIGILVIVLILYGFLIVASGKQARTPRNHHLLEERLALYGILTMGVGVLIISGGIDLSIGSVVALSSISLGFMLNQRVPVVIAVPAVLLIGATIGLLHGVLVTRLRLQPFVVTLCGLFIYRGLAYWLALQDPSAIWRGLVRYLSMGLLYSGANIQTGSAGNVGIGERAAELGGLVFLSSGYLDFTFLTDVPLLGSFLRLETIAFLFSYVSQVPMRLVLLLVAAGVLIVFLHYSVYGRYLFAIGANEQAARYAGIPTNRHKVLAYVICSVMAAIGGMMEMLELKTASPSNTGNWYELYAITGAVLGGCSLRGGQGTVVGILLGTAVLPLLRNLINFSAIPDDLSFMVIGLALLLGTIVDELLQRGYFGAIWRRARRLLPSAGSGDATPRSPPPTIS